MGEVLESRSETFPVGSFATGFTGVQSEAGLGRSRASRPVRQTNILLAIVRLRRFDHEVSAQTTPPHACA